MTQTLFLKGNPISWNKIASAHWRTNQRLKQEQAWQTKEAMQGRIISHIKGSVDITVVAFWKDKRPHDVDNIYIKGALDQLVKDGIIERDDSTIVRSVTLRGDIAGTKDEVGVYIIIDESNVPCNLTPPTDSVV